MGRGGPINERDALRIELENIIACQNSADQHLGFALLKLAQSARTVEDQEIIDEILEAREANWRGRKKAINLHPNKR